MNLALAADQKYRELYRAQLRRKNLIKRLAESPRPRAFNGRTGDGYTYLVHRDTYPENWRRGAWRVTYFRDAEPCGHAVALKYSEVLALAHEYGADLFNERSIS